MRARVTPDTRFIQIVEAEDHEFEQLKHSFKRRITNWRYHPLVRKKCWDGYISFYDKYNRIPVGLWNELSIICTTYDFKLKIEGIDQIIDYNFDEEDFRKWVDDFFSDHPNYKPRDYQIDACIPILKYRRNISEIATSAGKTLIMFMIFGYMFDRKKYGKFLLVVPNTNLIIQTEEDWEKYNNGKLKYCLQKMHGGTSKARKEADVIMGTFQTLVNLGRDFFDDIFTICIDEAHHTQATSIKKIISNCYNTKYAFGMSGTMLQNGTTEALTIQAYLGPLVNNISATFLIQNNYATPVFIKAVKLDYLDFDARKKLEDLRSRKAEIDGSKLLNLERRVVVENRPRFIFICDFISKATKNSLVLFHDVKDQYGRRIYDYLREHTKEKIIFYVDGRTSPALREDYIARMDEGEDKILVASFGTFSTGISIDAICNIFFAESYKSERIVRQSIGRGMRLMEGKPQVTIIDFIDDFSLQRSSKNYLLKHGEERLKIYAQQGFPFKEYRVKF